MASRTISKESKSNKTPKKVLGKTVYRASTNGRFVNQKTEMSESDKLTLRAWKYTYKNRRKSKD